MAYHIDIFILYAYHIKNHQLLFEMGIWISSTKDSLAFWYLAGNIFIIDHTVGRNKKSMVDFPGKAFSVNGWSSWVHLMKDTLISLPIGSMYGIYGNIYHQYTPNVSIYSIHGSYGLGNLGNERLPFRRTPGGHFKCHFLRYEERFDDHVVDTTLRTHVRN